jgi:hypothetical protein
MGYIRRGGMVGQVPKGAQPVWSPLHPLAFSIIEQMFCFVKEQPPYMVVFNAKIPPLAPRVGVVEYKIHPELNFPEQVIPMKPEIWLGSGNRLDITFR